MKLGDKFKIIRYNKNYTQDEMAKKLSISRMSLSKIENNKAFPNALILERLALEFNISIDNLLELNVINEKNKDIQIKKISKYCTYLDKKELDFITNLLCVMTNNKKI